MDETYSNNDTGPIGLLGINKKPKKKTADTPGLLQNQMNMSQEKATGALANMANNKGSLGTMNQGAMADTEMLKKKKKLLEMQ